MTDKKTKALAEQPAQQQEPVRKVYICTSCEGVYADAPVTKCDCMPDKDEFTEGFIYTFPPASKPWVGLTPNEKKEIERLSVYVESAIRHTEAKLKEKNA